MKLRNTKIALVIVMCLIVTTITTFSQNASAYSKQMAFSNPEEQGTFYVEGGEYSDNCGVLYSTTPATTMINVNIAEIHIRNDGTVWYLYDNILKYYNFYVFVAQQSTEISAVAIYDDSSGNAYCYKTPSGEYYYLPLFEDMKNKNYVTEKVASSDIPKEPTPKPTDKVKNTPKPSAAKIPTTTQAKYDVTVKTSGKTTQTTIKQNGKVVSNLSFNKKTGKGKFNGKKITKAKDAFIISGSYNCGFLTKTGVFKVINKKTKKVKKYSGKWKKVVKKKNLATTLKNGKKTKKITGI